MFHLWHLYVWCFTAQFHTLDLLQDIQWQGNGLLFASSPGGCLVFVGILASKVERRDSLARFLRNRPSRRELIERNIIPSQTEAERQRDRHLIGYRLNRSVLHTCFSLAASWPLLLSVASLFTSLAAVFDCWLIFRLTVLWWLSTKPVCIFSSC